MLIDRTSRVELDFCYLMGEKDVVDNARLGDVVGVGLEAGGLGAASAARALLALASPLEEEDEAEYGAVERLAQVVDLLDLHALDAQIVDEQREQARVALELEPRGHLSRCLVVRTHLLLLLHRLSERIDQSNKGLLFSLLVLVLLLLIAIRASMASSPSYHHRAFLTLVDTLITANILIDNTTLCVVCVCVCLSVHLFTAVSGLFSLDQRDGDGDDNTFFFFLFFLYSYILYLFQTLKQALVIQSA